MKTLNKTLNELIKVIEANNLPEFTQKSFLGGICYNLHNSIQFAENNISEKISELRELNSRINELADDHDAREIAGYQNRFERGLEWLEDTLQPQKDALSNLFDQAREVYHENFHETWTPPVKRDVKNKARKDFAKQRETFLSKYAA